MCGKCGAAFLHARRPTLLLDVGGSNQSGGGPEGEKKDFLAHLLCRDLHSQQSLRWRDVVTGLEGGGEVRGQRACVQSCAVTRVD